jgi:hypothetical protein
VVETDQLAVEQHLVAERVGDRPQLTKLSRAVAPPTREGTVTRRPSKAQLRTHASCETGS